MFQTFVMKCLTNSTHKKFALHLLTMFCKCFLWNCFTNAFVDNILQMVSLEIFYKCLIAVGFHTHNFKTF